LGLILINGTYFDNIETELDEGLAIPISEINDLTSNDAEIIFGTENIDNIDEDSLRYEIIITGIE
jgi:hypothetical protein